MPRVEDTGLVELSQMFRAAPDVSQGGGNTLLPQPGAEVGKQTCPPFPAASRSPSHLPELPTSVLAGATDFSAFCPPLSPSHTHTLCRGIQIPPPPGWLGRDLINPQTAKEGTESWDGG